MRSPFFALVLATVAACAPMVPPPTDAHVRMAAARFPEVTLEDLRAGRLLYVRRCAGCHNLRRPDHLTADRWVALLPEMARDARLSEKEQRAVLRYLVSASDPGPSPQRHRSGDRR